MARRHPAVALTWAAFKDAVEVGATVVRWIALDPLACRVWGHLDVTLATPEPITFCQRCTRAR